MLLLRSPWWGIIGSMFLYLSSKSLHLWDHYVSNIFRKTNISYPLMRTRSCAYLGVRNVSFSENVANVINEWPHGLFWVQWRGHPINIASAWIIYSNKIINVSWKNMTEGGKRVEKGKTNWFEKIKRISFKINQTLQFKH